MADHKQAGRPSSWPFVMFMAWLVWLPLPVGSNRPIWMAIATAWLCMIFIIIVVNRARDRFHTPRAFREARLAWLILSVLLIWQLLQLFAPAWIVPESILSAYRHAGVQAPGVTLDRFAGFEALLHSILVFGGFVCALLLVDSMYRVHGLLWVLVWVGVVMSVVTGITVMDNSQAQILGIRLSNAGSASGSFVNRNHFANYLVMTLAAGIGLLLSMQDTRQDSGWRQRLRKIAETLLGPKARLRIFLALMVITLVLTRSRMGNAAFFASLLIAGSVTLFLIRGRQRSLVVLIASLIVIDIFIVGAWFGVQQVVDRIQETVAVEQQAVHIRAQDRIDAAAETIEMIVERPVTGAGGGSFFTLFPQSRRPDLGFLDHAHNDYLEFTANFGLPAMLLWAFFLALTMLKCLAELRTRSHPLALGACFATFMAMTGMAIHSTVDFSLQIPANAVTFMVLLSLPWIVSARGKRS